MKKLILAFTAFGLLTTGAPNSKAGDGEWATAGKVLTGIFAAKVLHDVTRPRHYHRTTTVCTTQPAVVYRQPATVVYQQPPTVIYQQAPPTVVYQQPATVQSTTVRTTTQTVQQPQVVQQPPAAQPPQVVQPPQVFQQPQVVQQPVYVQQPVVVQQPVYVQQPAVVYPATTVCSPVTTTVVRGAPLVRLGGYYGHHRYRHHRHHHRGSFLSFGIFR